MKNKLVLMYFYKSILLHFSAAEKNPHGLGVCSFGR